MTTIRCEGHLIKKTGISPNNYKYWSSKSECDSWFLGKAFASFSNYSVIRPDPLSKSGFNVACVHVKLRYDETTECDYISFKQEEYSRYYHCKVTDREFVNENSCRLYFVIDYVATFWDSIKLGKCLVERTHVTDDFDGEFTASKYLLPEPISIECRHRPDLLLKNPFDVINMHLMLSNSSYCLNTSVAEDGTVNNPTMNFQSGAPSFGYSYYGDSSYVEELCGKYVTYTSSLINQSNSLTQFINSIYFAPNIVLANSTPVPVIEFYTFDFTSLVNVSFLPKIKHAKTIDYIKLYFTGNVGAELINFAEFGYNISFDAIYTGSNEGKCTIALRSATFEYNNKTISTNTWPSVSVSGSMNKYDFNVASGINPANPKFHNSAISPTGGILTGKF